jgi:hypothetical protein
MLSAKLSLIVTLSSLWPFAARAADPPTSEQVLAIYPITSGVAHSPDQALAKVVIVSPQHGPSVEAALASAKNVFQRGGIHVIDKAPPASLAQGQGPRRPDQHASEDPFLAFGKQVGADHVILIEVTDTLVLDKPGATGRAYLHDERVSAKGIGVKTGTVALEGMARWSQPVERAGEHLRELTAYAIARAICAPEKWVEASALNNGRGRCRQ